MSHSVSAHRIGTMVTIVGTIGVQHSQDLYLNIFLAARHNRVMISVAQTWQTCDFVLNVMPYWICAIVVNSTKVGVNLLVYAIALMFGNSNPGCRSLMPFLLCHCQLRS